MEYLTAEKYSFTTTALPDDTFAVVNFKGFEGISKPYEFTIMLVSGVPDIDLSGVLSNPAKLTFHREDGTDIDFHGILAQFEQLHEYQGFVFYRAHLVPKLWWLNLTMHNQVILNESVQDILENTLKDGGLTSMDYEFKLQGSYSKIDYVCQYGESHLNFVSRWCEREGIYYYFEQTAAGEKVIFTDTKISHTDLPLDAVLYYSPPSGLDTMHRTEVIKSYTCRERQLPKNVKLKDYNYERPTLEISGSADVEANGRGTSYLYGEHFLTSEEGNFLAQIRAEELLCRKREFFGESTVPFMAPGYTFSLQDHYRSDFNRKYLITELSHEGTQTGYLISGIRTALAEMEEQVYYRNQFTAIPSDVQFRPERKAQKPRISGTLNAKVDAEGSGTYAELDEQGRYKVRLPFDLNDEHSAGKASCFLRMMQPYAGTDHGMHFPLHKDTEVLLTFIDGDPDRPVIAGAVPNPETPSTVTSSNQTQSVIQTGGANKIAIEDNAGNERILMQSPTANSWIRMGAPNDPPSYVVDEDPGNGIRMTTEGKFDAIAKENVLIQSQDKDIVLQAEKGKIVQKESDFIHETSGNSKEYVHAIKETWGFSNDFSAVIGGKESFFGGGEVSVFVGVAASLKAAFEFAMKIGPTMSKGKWTTAWKHYGRSVNECTLDIQLISGTAGVKIVLDPLPTTGIKIQVPSTSIQVCSTGVFINSSAAVKVTGNNIKLKGPVTITDTLTVNGKSYFKNNVKVLTKLKANQLVSVQPMAVPNVTNTPQPPDPPEVPEVPIVEPGSPPEEPSPIAQSLQAEENLSSTTARSSTPPPG
ncbi:type VI secretion system tip protein VgrG [bacterium]|nr:type VI secretion system tip protein VgrG [bacterium]